MGPWRESTVLPGSSSDGETIDRGRKSTDQNRFRVKRVDTLPQLVRMEDAESVRSLTV